MNKDEAPASPKDAALRLALEALEYPLNQSHENFNVDMAELLSHRAFTAIKQALEQQEPEPVAWMWRCKPYCGWPEWSVSLNRPADSGRDGNKRTEGYEDIPLYTSPPKREPLTDEQKVALCKQFPDHLTFNAIHAVEAAHGIFASAQNKVEA